LAHAATFVDLDLWGAAAVVNRFHALAGGSLRVDPSRSIIVRAALATGGYESIEASVDSLRGEV